MPALSLQMDYIPAWTPVTGSTPFMPKPTMGFGVSSSLHWSTLLPSLLEKPLHFLCRTRRKHRKCPYFSSDFLFCLKSSASLILQGTETWKPTSYYRATKAYIKQESNNINITNPKHNSNRALSRLIPQISIWNSLCWFQCLFLCFAVCLETGTSITFTPSLPVMLTARIINKKWKHKQLHS